MKEKELLKIGIEYFNISECQLLSNLREKKLVICRICITYILYINDFKISKIAKLLKRDRTTIYHYLKIINNIQEKEIHLKMTDFKNFYLKTKKL